MKILYIIVAILQLVLQSTFCQTKEIKGDTAFYYKGNRALARTLNLTDFERSTNEFNFRFRSNGQIVEISKDSTNYSGSITNFIYHSKKANRSRTETLSNKIVLSSKQSEEVFNIIQISKVIELPTDEMIKDWQRGSDGITYIIEHSDEKIYWSKNYWTPSAQDSIPESIVILDFIKKLSDTLGLQQAYSSFRKTLPKTGCYSFGSMSTICYVANSLEFGYSGATKLPLGFYSSYSATYLGKTKINGGIAFQYNFDDHGYHHLNVQTGKWNILRRQRGSNDFIVYNYQNRILNIENTKDRIENHQIKYGLNLKNSIGVGLGLDFISRDVGGHIYAYKQLPKLNISTTLATSIFDNQVNYKAEIFKSFRYIRKFPIHRITLGLVYEDFMSYKDLYFGVRVLI